MADAWNIGFCWKCERHFCQECSSAEDSDIFCSRECERDYEAAIEEEGKDNG